MILTIHAFARMYCTCPAPAKKECCRWILAKKRSLTSFPKSLVLNSFPWKTRDLNKSVVRIMNRARKNREHWPSTIEKKERCVVVFSTSTPSWIAFLYIALEKSHHLSFFNAPISFGNWSKSNKDFPPLLFIFNWNSIGRDQRYNFLLIFLFLLLLKSSCWHCFVWYMAYPLVLFCLFWWFLVI